MFLMNYVKSLERLSMGMTGSSGGTNIIRGKYKDEDPLIYPINLLREPIAGLLGIPYPGSPIGTRPPPPPGYDPPPDSYWYSNPDWTEGIGPEDLYSQVLTQVVFSGGSGFSFGGSGSYG